MRVDGSDMASFNGVALGSFVAQVRGESVVVGRRPDDVHNVNCLQSLQPCKIVFSIFCQIYQYIMNKYQYPWKNQHQLAIISAEITLFSCTLL